MVNVLLTFVKILMLELLMNGRLEFVAHWLDYFIISPELFNSVISSSKLSSIILRCT